LASEDAGLLRRRRLDAVHQAAAALDPPRRAAFLDQACGDDPTLRAEVEALLEAHGETAASPAPAPEEAATRTLGADAASPSPARARVGPYRLLQQVGSGGMGTVYLAIRDDDQYRKRVAVKLVRRDSVGEEVRRRFRLERQILAGLDHENIARLLDGGTTEDGSPYLVMEYVEGMPIDQYCDAHGLSIRERLELIRPICSAVHFAHQNLVVHRDLKPGNIFVSPKGVPKLLDFGIAKLLNPELTPHAFVATRLDARMMTPEYASPEQVRGEPVTTAADVYALGVLLYENLTEIARAICEEQPTRPSTVVAQEVEATGADGVSRRLTPDSVSRTREGSPEKLRRRLAGDLDNIVLMAMRKETQRRYASAEQLSEDIRRHLEGRPVIARKDTLGYRTERFVARHRVGVAAATAVVLALVAGMAATAWQARVARAERARAEAALADVRKLANAFIFDVHDAIEKLPGSTPARRMVVERALEYLDRLAGDAPGTPPSSSSWPRPTRGSAPSSGPATWPTSGRSRGRSRASARPCRSARPWRGPSPGTRRRARRSPPATS
jgi:serine/threonine protein kinase